MKLTPMEKSHAVWPLVSAPSSLLPSRLAHPFFLPLRAARRFYLAYDHTDVIYEDAAMRAKIEAAAQALIAEEDARRWHPPGYAPGASIDGSTLLVSIHWVHCPYAGKPAWAHGDAVAAAFREGADYAMRMNDDTAAPVRKDWVDAFVADLRGRAPVPNLGVVGPACAQGASWILTHDFTHRTHASIFGPHYPLSLPDWSSDDWITIVYRQLGLTSRREDVPVEHRLHGQRYQQQAQSTRLSTLNAELAAGAEAVQTWLTARGHPRRPQALETVTCC